EEPARGRSSCTDDRSIGRILRRWQMTCQRNITKECPKSTESSALVTKCHRERTHAAFSYPRLPSGMTAPISFPSDTVAHFNGRPRPADTVVMNRSYLGLCTWAGVGALALFLSAPAQAQYRPRTIS